MKRVMRFFIVAVMALSCSTLTGNSLKDLPQNREYPIVVRHIVDPRLPALSEAEFQDMLERCAKYIKEYLGYNVSFFSQARQPLLEFAAGTKKLEGLPMMAELRESLLNVESETDRTRLKAYIDRLVADAAESTLRRHVPDYGRFAGRKEIAAHIHKEYVENLRKIQNIRTADGTPLAATAYADTLTYPFWDMALRHLDGAHFIFTNTIMADMELDIPIYVALRYGITTGLVEENRRNTYRAAGIIFTYPFLSRDGFFVSKRGREIPPDKLTDVIALYATHEFGHFLNHYRDYYDHEHCIMVPAHDLDYYGWYLDKKEKKCDLEHEKLRQF